MENINYEFKDIATLDIAESVSESAHVLIEDGGIIKRAPKSEVGGGAGVTSWNDLTDKPFGDEIEVNDMIIDSYSYTFEGGAGDGEGHDEVLTFSPLYLDGTDFNDKWTNGEEICLLWNGVEYTSTVEEYSGKGHSFLLYFDCVSMELPGGSNSINEFRIIPCDLPYEGQDKNLNATFSLYRKKKGLQTLDEKYIPETISRTNHNHSWKDIGEKINWLLSETEYTGGTILMSESIKVGKTYIISVDDYEYTGVASEEYNGIEYAPYVNVKGAGTIERNELTLYVSEGSIVSVREVEFKQIDEKYLPDSVKCGSGAIIITGSGSLDSSDYEAVLDMDSDDIINLIEQDKYPILKITINSGGSHFNSGDKAIMTYQGNKEGYYVFTSVLMTKVIRLYIESGRGTYADFNIADDV